MPARWFIHLISLSTLALLMGCGSTTAPVVSAEPLPESLAEETATVASTPDLAPGETAFTFPPDGVGKQLEDRLTPPRQVPLPPVPFVSEPTTRKPTRLDRGAEPAPPLADLTTPPRLLPSEKPRTVKDRTPLDAPPLAADLTPRLPQAIWFSITARAWAMSPDANYLLPKGPGGNELPAPTSDPTVETSHRLVIGSTPPLRDQPAPPVNLSAPDPFEAARAVRLRTPPGELDEPASPTQRPPLPPLPVK